MVGAFQSLHSNNTKDLIWKVIWEINASPKIRTFIWRVAREALATQKELFQCRSASSSLCPVCQNQEEFVLHMLLWCPWVEPIWFGGLLGLRLVGEGFFI